MAQPVLLQESYERAMMQDIPRYQLPQNACWRLVDFIPNLNGIPLRKRSSWEYGSGALVGAIGIRAVAYGDFEPTPKLLAVGDNSHLYEVTEGTTTVTDLGSFPFLQPGPGIFFRDRIIWCDRLGVAKPVWWKPGSPITTLTAAPTARTGTVHISRLVLGGVPGDNADNVYFSGPGDATAWNAENFIPTGLPITALASLRNTLLVFSAGEVNKITGTIPPAEPNDDMSFKDFAQIGCTDDRSLVQYGEATLFGNRDGVWYTDGSGTTNTFQVAGVASLWDRLTRDYTMASWGLVAGAMRSRYFLTLRNDLNQAVTTFALDIERRRVTQLANVNAVSYVGTHQGEEELYFAMPDNNRVGNLGTITHAGRPADGNGVPILPVVESAYYRVQAGPKRIRDLYITAAMVNGVNARLNLEFIPRPEQQTYFPIIANGSAPETIVPEQISSRHRIPFRIGSEGFALRISQQGVSDETMLFDILADMHVLEGSKPLR